MKKTCKILFLVVLIIMLVFTFSAYVDAAETIDYSTYPDLDTDTTTTQNNSNTNNADTNTEKDVKAEKTNTNTNNENKANIATTSHPQTGVYNNKVCILIATITIIAIVVAYVKIKKYNY